jgi:HK97 family phage major capsid protein
MPRSAQTAIRKLKDGNGNYLWQQSLQIGVPSAFNGYPVALDDNLPAIGAGTYPIYFGNFKRAYLIIDRAGIRVIRDPYTSPGYIKFFTWKRVGGGVSMYEAVKCLKISA